MKIAKIKTYKFTNKDNISGRPIHATRHVLLEDEIGMLGMPLFYPNLYLSTSGIRKHPLNTQRLILRAIMQAYAWAVREGIDFEDRLLNLDFFNADAIVNLADATLLEYGYLTQQAISFVKARESSRKRPKIEKIVPDEVIASTANQRLGYISSYFKWLSNRTIMSLDYADRADPEGRLEEMLEEIDDCTWPEGLVVSPNPLSKEAEEFLREVIEPGSLLNVWGKETQFRNYLIVRFLLDLALRRGEVLSFYYTDFTSHDNKLHLIKRPNDPIDPRLEKPAVKTVGRSLRLDGKMSRQLQDYITGDRKKHRDAQKHPILFTSSQDGAPLSLSAVDKLVRELRKHELLKDVSPHMLRHTWNDRYVRSEIAAGTPMELILYRQRMLCGWSKTSQMPENYSHDATMDSFEKLMLDRQKGQIP